MQRLPLFLLLCAATVSAGCGGGGGSGPGTTGPTLGPAPEVAVLFCAGHDFSGTAPIYLAGSAAVAVEAALGGASHGFQSFHFADASGNGGNPGYADLVELLRAIRDEWIGQGTRVLVIGHSHGCVRSHAAMRAVPDCPVRLLVDLDGSSNGFGLVHPASEAAAMGGNPIDAYDLGVDVVCAAYPAIADEVGTQYDLEDVVLPSAEEAFEVRSGELVANPLQLEPFDERWNARLDGTQTGITCLYSATSHAEVHQSAGTTMATVAAWILDRLASDTP